jgi:hypothetical protein
MRGVRKEADREIGIDAGLQLISPDRRRWFSAVSGIETDDPSKT